MLGLRRASRSLRGELQASWRLLAASLVVMLVTSVSTTAYLVARVQPSIDVLGDVQRDLRMQHEGMLREQTAMRAWLATGDLNFVTSAQQGARQAVTAERSLKQHLPAADLDSESAEVLQEELVAAKLWRDAWASKAAKYTGSDVRQLLISGGRVTEFTTDAGLFDPYVEKHTEAEDAITHVRDARGKRQQQLLIGIGVAQLTVVLLMLLVDVLRRRRLIRKVDAPVQVLLESMRRMREGHASAQPPPLRVQEFQALADGLTEMTDALLQAQEELSTRERSAQRLAEGLQVILHVARETAGSLSLRYVAESVAGAAAVLGRADAVVWIRSPETGDFAPARRSGDPHGVMPPEDLPVSPAVAQASADGRVVREGDASYFPLVVGGTVVGVLEVHDAPDGVTDPEVDVVLEALALNAATALESARLHATATEQAQVDALTGLLNRRRLQVDLGQEVERAVRHGRPLSLCMLDVDHFKRVNDGAGHTVGDEWLRSLAEVMRTMLRSTDVVYRFGGEEFTLLLPETPVEEARQLAERLREAVSRAVGPSAHPHITVSIGVAALEDSVTTSDELLERADRALYSAKRDGRDRVVVMAGGASTLPRQPATSARVSS